MVEVFSVLKIFKFLSWRFGQAGSRLDKRAKVNFKIYEVKAISQWNVAS